MLACKLAQHIGHDLTPFKILKIQKLKDQIRKYHSVKFDYNFEKRLILPFFFLYKQFIVLWIISKQDSYIRSNRTENRKICNESRLKLYRLQSIEYYYYYWIRCLKRNFPFFAVFFCMIEIWNQFLGIHLFNKVIWIIKTRENTRILFLLPNNQNKLM